MNITTILELLKIKKKESPRDWSKSDQEVLDNFKQLQKAGERGMQIVPLNQSNYNTRRFSGRTSPDYTGPGEFSHGTNDRMPGTTPTKDPKPKHIKKKYPSGRNKHKTPGLI